MRYFLLSLFCFCSILSFGQNQDSLEVVNYKWDEKKIEKGIKLKKAHFVDSSLFNSNQYVSIVEINPKLLKKYKFIISAYDTLTHTSTFAKNNNALCGINGSYFALRKPYNSVDYIRVDGVELAPNEYNGGAKRLFHQGGALVIKDGIMDIAIPAGDSLSVLNWERTLVADDVITSGPLLFFKGADVPGNTTSHYTARHPRSVVALDRDGTIWLIAIDGRAKEAAGMNLDEVRSFLKWLGAYSILNLDGGGSTALFVESLGIVNHPTDNKIFDNKGERKVANTVLLKKRK